MEFLGFDYRCGFSSTQKTPIELAIDFTLHDFEMAGQSVQFSVYFFLI